MPSSDRKKVGLFGFGVMGRNHARTLSSLPQFEVVGVFDPFEKRAIQDAGYRYLDSLDRLPHDEDLDFAVVAAPTSLHLELGTALAQRGIPTLMEKPVAASLEDSREIEALFATNETSCFVGHIERFNPALSLAKTKIDSGLIGDVLQISTFRQGPLAGRISDVGVVFDLLSHDVDTTLWTSSSEYSFLTGISSIHSNSTHEDGIEVIGRLANGTVVTHSANRISPTKRRQTFFWGSKGLLLADSLRSELTFFENGNARFPEWTPANVFQGMSLGDATMFQLTQVEPLALQHTSVLKWLDHGDRGDLCTIGEGVAVVEVLEKVQASSVEN